MLIYDDHYDTYLVQVIDNYGRLKYVAESSDLEVALIEIYKTLN